VYEALKRATKLAGCVEAVNMLALYVLRGESVVQLEDDQLLSSYGLSPNVRPPPAVHGCVWRSDARNARKRKEIEIESAK
jgi:hypothetical protein